MTYPLMVGSFLPSGTSHHRLMSTLPPRTLSSGKATTAQTANRLGLGKVKG
jgi:hypothetical protein